MVELIVDDQSPQIEYLCPVTKQQVSGTYFNNTWTTIADGRCREGWFRHTFYGTGVQIIGFSSRVNQNYYVKIDEGHWVAQSGRGSFKSSLLPDGLHTVSYAAGVKDFFPTFDYLVVTAGPSTPLQDHSIIVDDTDSSLVYRGNWTTQIPESFSHDLSTATFQNTTHWSTAVGDTVSFQFRGNSIDVVGAFTNLVANSNFTATYTLDGIPFTRSIPEGSLDRLPMARLFDAEVASGDHTLVINITHISPPLAVGIDFLTYNASFAKLTSMPGHTSSSSLTSSPRISAGAIAGSVIGGVALLIVASLTAAFFSRWRCRTRRRKEGKRWLELKY